MLSHSNQADNDGTRALISSNIASLEMQLKVFLKSRRSILHSFEGMEGSSSVLATEWTMASHPTRTPTLSCRGVRILKASSCAKRERHLEVSRRSTSPTAIGRWPPPFFLLAWSVAPQRWIATARGRGGGALPTARKFTTLVRAWRAWAARMGEGQRTASLRWVALRLEEPGAEPPGKDFNAFRTSSTLKIGTWGHCGARELRVFGKHFLHDFRRDGGKAS